MPDARTRIEQLASEFVSQLQNIAREEVVRILDGAATGVPSGRPRVRAKGVAVKRARGEKRSPEALEALQERALVVIKSKPGLRIEEINQELGFTTGELALPIKKLIATKAIRTTGVRRATRYFPAGGNPRAKNAGAKSPSKKRKG